MSDAELTIAPGDDSYVSKEEQAHFNKYLIAKPIDYHLTSTSPEVAAAVECLCEQIGYTSDKAKKHMRMLICNLYFNYAGWSKRYVRLCLSKANGGFKLMRQYNRYSINYDPLCKCLVGLVMNRYVFRKKGYFNLGYEDGYQTRLKPREKLIRLLEGRFKIRSEMIHQCREQQTIILRTLVKKKPVTFKRLDGSVKRFSVKIKKVKEYPDNDRNVKAWRTGLREYNDLLERTFIDIDLAGYVPEPDEEVHIDLSKKFVKRIFTEKLSLGGRYYGGWWQLVPRELRERIIINGRHVVEVDYAGLHIHILYALRDKKLGDKLPYIVAKDNDPNNQRPIYKRLMLAGINAKKDRGCIDAVRDEIRDNPQDYPPVPGDNKLLRKQLNKMLKQLKEHHPVIRKDINSGKGLRAQKIDSEIAYRVIRKMTGKGIPVLCIHDSFICRDIDKAEVTQAMQDAYIAELNHRLSRRKNKITLTEADVFTDETSIITKMPEYMITMKDEPRHVVNPVFRRASSYYERYIKYLASKRTKGTHNVTINVMREGSSNDKVRLESQPLHREIAEKYYATRDAGSIKSDVISKLPESRFQHIGGGKGREPSV